MEWRAADRRAPSGDGMDDLFARMRQAYLNLQAGRIADAQSILRDVAAVAPLDLVEKLAGL